MSGRYNLQRLLDNCVQPFRDLSEEEFEALKQSIREDGGNPRTPILLSSDEYRMFSGAQRCQAMLEMGRVSIDAKHVRIVRSVTKDNVLEAAVEDEWLRRKQTPEQKAETMHMLARNGWSQRKIAKVAGMTQARVSQLMKQFPDDNREALAIRGKDGKTYFRMPAEPAPPTQPTPPREKGRKHPWEMEGKNFKAIVKALNVIREGDFPTGLTLQEYQDLAATLRLLTSAADDLLKRMEEAGLLSVKDFPAPPDDGEYTPMSEDFDQ